LTSTNESRLPESAWLPALVERFKADPKRWRPLTLALLSALQTSDDAAREALSELAKDPAIKVAASAALAPMLLNSSQTREVLSGIQMLVYEGSVRSGGRRPQLRYVPELAGVSVIHQDEAVRKAARGALRYIDAVHASAAADQLLTILNHADDAETQTAVLRALAAMAPQFDTVADVPEMLKKWLTGGNKGDERVAVAAAVAIQRAVPGSSEIQAEIKRRFKKHLLEQEEAKLFPPEVEGGEPAASVEK
jgi:hypothetical protein